MTGFLHTFYYCSKKKKKRRRRYFFVFKEKSWNLSLSGVKHGRRFQNTNYNWVVSLNLLKALVWLIFPPSNSCCWVNVNLSIGWVHSPEGLQRLPAHVRTHWFLQDNVTNKIAPLACVDHLGRLFYRTKVDPCCVLSIILWTVQSSLLQGMICLRTLFDSIGWMANYTHDFLLSGRYYFRFFNYCLPGEFFRNAFGFPLREVFCFLFLQISQHACKSMF